MWQRVEATMPANPFRRVALGILILGIEACFPALARFRFPILPREVIVQRLQAYKGNDIEREATLKRLFEEANCKGDQIYEAHVPGLQETNLTCTLPGTTDSVILVGAHFDHVSAGEGVVDNWTGASMLPSLYQVLTTKPPCHTFVFVAFAGEEEGLVGSQFYARSLTPDNVKKIAAMINMDSLGLGPTEVWMSRSDEKLVRAFAAVSHSLQMPVRQGDIVDLGDSDEESFILRKVPTITFHTLTSGTLSLLHTSRDTYSAVRFDDYYDSYRLLCAYLSYLDEFLPPENPAPEKK